MSGSPGDSSSGPLTTDRHPAENPDAKFTPDATPRRRQKPTPTPVLATATGVVGGTGRHRWLLIFRCPCCGMSHVAHGRGELPPGMERPAACGRGRLLLVPVTEQRGAA
jgi:hypothetical protein